MSEGHPHPHDAATSAAQEDAPPFSLRLDLGQMIEWLADNESGIGFVYRCLDHLVTTLGLVDAIAVVDHPLLGRQVFRAGRRPLGGGEAGAAVASGPGVLADPPVIGPGDGRALSGLFQAALNLELARHDASHDGLTGLLNRRSFDAALARAAAQADRYGWAFCLALLDMDGMKALNDELGHVEGDRVLRMVGTELRRSLRTGDVAARVGGDEMAIILTSGVPEAARRLRDRLSDTVSGAFGRRLRFSVGVACAPGDAVDPVHLYRLADSHLYEDKRA
ncbi:MAG TPA: GGDEF domain-containing protein [Acidimicrobiales bacterium]|nr:GGDEF domain-containing protein [Acidimicrobiales bacterium]